MSKGIDIPINKLLGDIAAYLWNGKTNSFFGRVFRNERGDSISPEIWINTTKYIEVLKDTEFDGQCFFDVQPTDSVDSNVHNATVWICFMVDLNKVYPLLTRTEATEQAHIDTQSIIIDSMFEITGLIRGFDGFSTYDWGSEGQARADMSPHYLFRFNTSLEYNINC
jgi:hypothetical protein